MYKYIFYKLYQISKRTEKQWGSGQGIPEWIAIFSISMLQFVNLITLYVILVHGLSFFDNYDLSFSNIIVTGLILYILNYLFFVRDNKYSKIEKYYDKDSNKLKKTKTILFWLYVVVSFVLMFVCFEMYSIRK